MVKKLKAVLLGFVKKVLSDDLNPFSIFFKRIVLPSVGEKALKYVFTVFHATQWSFAPIEDYGETSFKGNKLCVELSEDLGKSAASVPCLRATILHELAHAVRLYAARHKQLNPSTPPRYSPSAAFLDHYGCAAGEMGLFMQEICLGGITEQAGVRVLAHGETKLVKYSAANLAALGLEEWTPPKRKARVVVRSLGKCGTHKRGSGVGYKIKPKRGSRKRDAAS